MKIALLGDIGLFGDFCFSENENLKSYFADVSDFLSDFDVVVGNLETPFVDKVTPYGAKSAHIYANSSSLELLSFLHVDHVNLSNNHIYDFGKSSYDLTKSLLDQAGIKYFGVEAKQCFVEVSGERLALHGYCSYNTNPQKMTFDESEGINALDLDWVRSEMEKNDAAGYFNIVSMHSGQEHIHYPSIDDMDLARGLAKKMPYIYYGHHPHVVQGIEQINDSLIAYSLGNFCFSDVYTSKSDKPLVVQSEANKTGLILCVEIVDNQVVDYQPVPIYMGVESMLLGGEALREAGVSFDLEKYSSGLDMDRDEYSVMRANLISKFISSRKELRDFKWYIKRLNFGSVVQIIQSRINAKKYLKHVKLKLI